MDGELVNWDGEYEFQEISSGSSVYIEVQLFDEELNIVSYDPEKSYPE